MSEIQLLTYMHPYKRKLRGDWFDRSLYWRSHHMSSNSHAHHNQNELRKMWACMSSIGLELEWTCFTRSLTSWGILNSALVLWSNNEFISIIKWVETLCFQAPVILVFFFLKIRVSKKMKNILNVANGVSHKRAKSQLQIFWILSYTKMTKVGIWIWIFSNPLLDFLIFV